MEIRRIFVFVGMLWMAPAVQSAHQVNLPATLASPNAQVVDVHIGLSYSEGPAVDPAGNLYFSEDPDVNTGRIWKITPQGEKSVYKDPSRGANGLEFDNAGRLHIAMLDSALRVETDGKVTVLHASKSGTSIGRVNDLSINSAGALFFTNLNGNTLFFRNTTGEITTRNFSGVNGVEWIEEKSTVYVASGGLQKCKSDNTTGVLSDCSAFISGNNGATDGLTVDVQGNIWRANWGQGKFYVNDSTGRELGSITIDAVAPPAGKRSSPGAGGNASNCHFGGPDLKTLYLTGDGGLYKIDLLVAGRRRPNWPTSAHPTLRPAAGKDVLRTGERVGDPTRFLLQSGNGSAVGMDGRRIEF